jgi:hypothetical protein
MISGCLHDFLKSRLLRNGVISIILLIIWKTAYLSSQNCSLHWAYLRPHQHNETASPHPIPTRNKTKLLRPGRSRTLLYVPRKPRHITHMSTVTEVQSSSTNPQCVILALILRRYTTKLHFTVKLGKTQQYLDLLHAYFIQLRKSAKNFYFMYGLMVQGFNVLIMQIFCFPTKMLRCTLMCLSHCRKGM